MSDFFAVIAVLNVVKSLATQVTSDATADGSVPSVSIVS